MLNNKQLVWRCRRGIRELDVLFDRFLTSEYPELEVSEQRCFQALLEVQDPLIMDWLFGRSTPDDLPTKALVQRLQALSGI